MACFGCASSRQIGQAQDWQDPDSSRPLSMLATQGISSRVLENYRTPAIKPEVPASNSMPAATPSATALPVQAPLAPTPTTLVALRDWCAATGLSAPMPLEQGLPGFALTNPSGEQFRLVIGSQVAGWQGMDVHLGYAPVLIQNQPYVQSADIKSTLAPLLRGNGMSPISGRVIVLDPGHGGTDSGTVGAYGAKEKDLTLDLARRLQGLLVNEGWEVYVTRTGDTEMALSNRVAFADSVGANLFLSLHFNSAPPDKRGLETYCLTPAGVPSTLTRGYNDELDLLLPNNNFDAQNVQVAVGIHRALLAVNEHRDRGVRRARFPTVLRGQKRPAVLIEGGYLSNRSEARLITDGAHRQRMAEAIALALHPFSPAQNGKSRATAPVDAAAQSQ